MGKDGCESAEKPFKWRHRSLFTREGAEILTEGISGE